jgi:hypothetical protein
MLTGRRWARAYIALLALAEQIVTVSLTMLTDSKSLFDTIVSILLAKNASWLTLLT